MMLNQARDGDADAAEKLFARLLNDLRETAGQLMLRECSGHTLQPTAVINEACVRLLQQNVLDRADNRRYLFGAANRAMRQVLVEYSRDRHAQKRGGDRRRESFDILLDNFAETNGFQFEALNAALEELEADSPRQREVIEHRFFGGFSITETAELLSVSEATVERDWRLARTKLYAMLRHGE